MKDKLSDLAEVEKLQRAEKEVAESAAPQKVVGWLSSPEEVGWRVRLRAKVELLRALHCERHIRNCFAAEMHSETPESI